MSEWKTTAIAPVPPGMTAKFHPEDEDREPYTYPVMAMLVQTGCDDDGEETTRVVLGVLDPWTGLIKALPDCDDYDAPPCLNLTTVLS